MNFVYPQFLYALSLLAIPVIIHLFNFRRFKKIYFTNVKFLKEIKEETTSRSRLKHLLVLLSRILAVSFLVFAFAQPYIPLSKKTVISNDKAITVFIDNSFSMEAAGKEGTLLDEALDKAREIALAYNPSDNFQLLTNDFEAHHQRLMNREEFLSQLDNVKITSSVKTMSEIISRQSDALNNTGSKEKTSFIISDFQQPQSDFKKVKADSSMHVSLVPVNVQNVSNIFIDTCFFSAPVVQLDKPTELNVRIVNGSDSDAENIPVKLFVNGIQKSLAAVTVKAGNQAMVKLTFTVSQPGFQKCEIEITDHPITFDDKFYFSFEIRQHLNLLCINGTNASPYLKALFEGDNFFNLKNTSVSQIDYNTMLASNVVFLNELNEISSGLAAELKKFIEKGGSLLVFPDSGMNASGYNDFLVQLEADLYNGINDVEEKVDKLNMENILLSTVFDEKQMVAASMDLPVVFKYYEFAGSTRSNRQVIMKLQSGSSFMSSFEFGKGKLYLFAVPLKPSFSNFSRHSLFVPIIYRAALLSQHRQNMFYILGKDNMVSIDASLSPGEEVLHFINVENKIDIIPEIRHNVANTSIIFNDQVKDAGNYDLVAGKKEVAMLAFNYSNKESLMHFYSKDDLDKAIAENHLTGFTTLAATAKNITGYLQQANYGKQLWKWCVIAVLIFLGFEILLLRLWK